MSALVVVHPGRVVYGAEEPKRVAHRYGFLALTISALIHFSIIGAYYLNLLLVPEVPLRDPLRNQRHIVSIGDFPRIPGTYTLPSARGHSMPKVANAGTPVAVPDDADTKERTIASQPDLADNVDPHGLDYSPGEEEHTPIEIPDETPPPIWVLVEKEPALVKSVAPVYPELALKAGMEGKVYVKIWVDKEGKPRQVEFLKGEDIFKEAALAAAKELLFTPAYMNNGPVSVWVCMPFTFKLTGPK
jgi:TonB family protein